MPSDAAKPIMVWDDLLSRPKPEADRRIAYGPGALQFVDLWMPKSRGPHPVVLMLHGGCWQTEIADRTIMNYIAADLRERGIAVWNVEYRGVDRDGGGYPGTYLDVGAAADLLAKDRPGLGLKTDRVVAVGHSAGGHLALWLANRPALPAASPIRGADPLMLAAAISQGGLPDLEFSSNTVGHACGTVGARAMAGVPPVYAATSPIAMAKTDVPQFQINGALDRIAPPAYAIRYAASLSGMARSGEIVPGEGHVELIAPDSRAWEQTVDMIKMALEP